LVLVLFVASSSCFEKGNKNMKMFREWMDLHGKPYDTPAEFATRFGIFKENLRRYDALNRESTTVVHGPTIFSDITHEEFKHKYLLKDYTSPMIRGEEVGLWHRPVNIPQDLPTNYSWVTKGATTPIYNQGQCGSCWAFSATENIESMNKIHGNPLTSLSMQQIVDCDTNDDGCNGGDTSTAYQYVIKAGGLESFKDYPYTGEDGKCTFEKSKVAQTISSWHYVTRTRDEKAMQEYTYTTGPPSVCVDASTWDSYNGGVYTRKDCGVQLDHCVQIVGWTEVKSMKVWLVRNSWGTSWGNAGYLYVAMGENACGIAQDCTSTDVK